MSGRPRLHDTPDKLAEARKAWRHKARKRSVVLEAEALDLLKVRQDQLAGELGFTPSLSQVLCHVLTRKEQP